MLSAIILSYLPYSLVTAYTPGPNNIVSLYAVSQKGWRGGKNVLWGIAAGFLIVMLICALLCYGLAHYIPGAARLLKYVGAAYIAWLALHIWRSQPEEGGGSQISFWNGFWLEFVNVKIILYALTIYTGYVLPLDANPRSLLLHACIITAIGVSGTLTWAAAGTALQNFLRRYYRPFNALMALILLYCAVDLVI